MTQQATATSNPLVHLLLRTSLDTAGNIQNVILREQPFIGDLQLDADPEDHSLLIAVGEMMAVPHPLSVSRISCLARMAILWLDHDRWLVLPAPGSSASVSQCLQECFGRDIELQRNQNDEISAQLSEAAVHYLLSSSNTSDYHREADIRKNESLSRLTGRPLQILSLQDMADYQILVRQSAAEQLWSWLDQTQLATAV